MASGETRIIQSQAHDDDKKIVNSFLSITLRFNFSWALVHIFSMHLLFWGEIFDISFLFQFWLDR